MEQILLRKYQQAMAQLQGAFDLAFQRTAELEAAMLRISELERELKEKEREFKKQEEEGVANYART